LLQTRESNGRRIPKPGTNDGIDEVHALSGVLLQGSADAIAGFQRAAERKPSLDKENHEELNSAKAHSLQGV